MHKIKTSYTSNIDKTSGNKSLVYSNPNIKSNSNNKTLYETQLNKNIPLNGFVYQPIPAITQSTGLIQITKNINSNGKLPQFQKDFKEDKKTNSKDLDNSKNEKKLINLTDKKEEKDSEEEVFDNQPKDNNEDNNQENEEEEENLSPLSEEDENDEIKTEDILLAQFEKVHRVKRKWKVVFKDTILHINGKDIVFDRINGELVRDW